MSDSPTFFTFRVRFPFTYPDALSRSAPFKVVTCLASVVFMPVLNQAWPAVCPPYRSGFPCSDSGCVHTRWRAAVWAFSLLAVVLSDWSVRLEMDISLRGSQWSRLSYLAADAPSCCIIMHFYVNLKLKVWDEKSACVWLCFLIFLSFFFRWLFSPFCACSLFL